MAARYVRDEEAAGSNPATPTSFLDPPTSPFLLPVTAGNGSQTIHRTVSHNVTRVVSSGRRGMLMDDAPHVGTTEAEPADSTTWLRDEGAIC